MKPIPFAAKKIAVAVSVTLLPFAVFAQTSTTDSKAEEKKDALNLDNIVVTGQSQASSKMKTSTSVSTLGEAQIQRSGANNAAELLRSVPGIRSESSGGEGNANITVRGVPISAGGARYVQLQEDGLPILLFGDIAFGTADQFLRADFTVDRLEVVRGGSASTLASNSPGGLINFISKTGDETGGAIGLGLGLDFRQTRFDFNYGAAIGPSTRVHVGGFYRTGEGSGRDVNFKGENGGQLKANITHEFGKGNYIRASLKVLDDSTPTNLPVPVLRTGGNISALPGIDPRRAFFITGAFPADRTLSRDGTFVSSDPKDGLRVKSTAFGVEGGFNLGDGWRVENKFRTAQNSGRFIGLFPASAGASVGLPANTFVGHLFNTSLDSLDNTFNDLKISKTFKLDGNTTLGLNGGWFYGKQDVAQTWYWNGYVVDLNGNNPTFRGQYTSLPAPIWGNCCVRTWDTNYTTDAPYVAVTFESGPWNIDASVRRDKQDGRGFTLDGNSTATGFNPASRRNVNYSVNKTSYSFGANFAVDRNLAIFGRASEGVAFSADRLLYGNPLDGSVPIAINLVKQQEIGFKWRSGGFNSFVTYFNARTAESNYEATTRRFTSTRYKASGIEAEAGYRQGNFRVTGGLTYTSASITASLDPTEIGKTPRRQAKFVYQIAPSYSFGPVEVGASIVGTGKSWAENQNQTTLPAFAVVNTFLNYQFNQNITFGVAVNNLFDKVGYTEAEGQQGLYVARSVNGRAIRGSVKYAF